MRRILFVALTALVAFGLIAPAATADIQGTGVLQGNADVGRHFLDADGEGIDCTKDTAKRAFARGQGLFLPTTGPTTNGVWSLHTNVAFAGTGVPPGTTGTLDACGWLQHVGRADMGGVGPACGASKGHSGRGQVNFVPPPRGLNLFDLGWKTSAGGTLPVTGKYQVWNGMKPDKDKKNKWGNLLAQVQAQGGAPCATPKNCPDQKTAGPGTPGCGAQSFVVTGTFELVQPGDRNDDGAENKKDDVIRPKSGTRLCKDTDDQECLYDDNKFGKEPGPGPKPTS